jgi:FKBP-type peptidyl-prolyl cis-trans isomerase SlyD
MLTISENKVVTFEYTLKNDNGEIIDSSTDNMPITYLHGSGNIIPGLEYELEGKKIGDKFHASIEPEDGYGIRHEELVQTIDRDRFSHLPNIEVGMQVQAYDEDGMQLLTIVDISGNDVTLDANHPLSGQRLHFDIEIIDMREATEEEIEFGLYGNCDCGDAQGCGGGCSGCH